MNRCLPAASPDPPSSPDASSVPFLIGRLTRGVGGFTTVVAIALAIGWGGFGFGSKSADANERPNIVWIMSEDNSKHYLRHFDPDGAPAPNIEALAGRGITFDRAFSNSPVCSVARSTLISCCYAPRVGIQYHRRSKLANLSGEIQMFPAYLRDAGYYTTNHRKEDYNLVKSPDPWDDSSGRASWKNRPEPDMPFFHVETHTDSHESRLHFSAEEMRQPTETAPDSVRLQPYYPDTPTFRYTRARYHDRIGIIDRIVGKTVEDLRAAGKLDETFIFYFGDHGGVLPGSKGYAGEAGLHVPLVVYVPPKFAHLVDRPLGSRTDGFVEFVDFGATALRLAGVEVPVGIDGRPFLGPGVDRQAVDARDETVGYADRFDEKYDLVRTLRQGKWKYARNFEAFLPDGLQNNYRYKMLAFAQWRRMFEAGKLNDVQSQFFRAKPVETLYDLEADPHETKNLAGDPRHAERLERMRGRLTQRLKGWPDLSFFPEAVLVERALDDPIGFGKRQAERIGKLIDTANLALLPADEAIEPIRRALGDDDPWVRYWAVIASTCRRDPPTTLRSAVERLADDEEPLVSARVAEFVALRGEGSRIEPRELLYDSIARATRETEALQMLNTAVLFDDFTDGRFEIDVARIRFGFEPKPNSEVTRRTDYFSDRH